MRLQSILSGLMVGSYGYLRVVVRYIGFSREQQIGFMLYLLVESEKMVLGKGNEMNV